MNTDKFYFSSRIRNETKVKGQLKTNIITDKSAIHAIHYRTDLGFPTVGRQPVIWPKFPKNCIKCRKLDWRGGVRVQHLLCRSATVLRLIWHKNAYFPQFWKETWRPLHFAIWYKYKIFTCLWTKPTIPTHVPLSKREPYISVLSTSYLKIIFNPLIIKSKKSSHFLHRVFNNINGKISWSFFLWRSCWFVMEVNVSSF